MTEDFLKESEKKGLQDLRTSLLTMDAATIETMKNTSAPSRSTRFACSGEAAAFEAGAGNSALCPRCGEWFNDDDRLVNSDLCPECEAMAEDTEDAQ